MEGSVTTISSSSQLVTALFITRMHYRIYVFTNIKNTLVQCVLSCCSFGNHSVSATIVVTPIVLIAIPVLYSWYCILCILLPPIFSYEVHVRESCPPPYQPYEQECRPSPATISYFGASRQTAITNLLPYRAYEFSVVSVNDYGRSNSDWTPERTLKASMWNGWDLGDCETALKN